MMRILLAFFIALPPMAAVAAEPVQPKAPKPVISRAVPIRDITPGIEVLLSDRLELLAGKRVALLTNQTGVDRKGVRNVDLLRAHPAINLVALFSPEHGVRGVAQAGEKVASGIDSKSGLPVYSLYGETKMPTDKMMQGIDIVLVDLQDVGTRFYTYSSTLLYMLRAAETSGAEVIVLDRPNPQGGVMIEGPVLEPAFASFVGSFARISCARAFISFPCAAGIGTWHPISLGIYLGCRPHPICGHPKQQQSIPARHCLKAPTSPKDGAAKNPSNISVRLSSMARHWRND
jgi:hypothetical protein